MNDLPTYRAPMRSRDARVDEGAAVERALEHGLVGIGGRLVDAPDSLETAVSAVRTVHEERAARRLARFAAVPEGSAVWTRDVEGAYWVGRITGPWRYDGRQAASLVDLVHVRPCAWADRPARDADVPAAVRATFARGGRNWQRIRALG